MTSIAEMSALTGFSIHTLRYYEQIGLVDVPRTAGGHRDYSQANQVTLIAIMHFRRAGLSLAQIKEIIDQNDIPASLRIYHERKKALQAELEALQSTINYLDQKIDYFTEKL